MLLEWKGRQFIFHRSKVVIAVKGNEIYTQFIETNYFSTSYVSHSSLFHLGNAKLFRIEQDTQAKRSQINVFLTSESAIKLIKYVGGR